MGSKAPQLPPNWRWCRTCGTTGYVRVAPWWKFWNDVVEVCVRCKGTGRVQIGPSLKPPGPPCVSPPPPPRR